MRNKNKGLVKGEIVGRLGIEYDTRTTLKKNYTEDDIKSFRNSMVICADRNGANHEEIRALLEMLGYLPSNGHYRSNGKSILVRREPYFEVA